MKQETFWENEDDTKTKQEDLEEKLKYVEEDIVNLKNKNGELKSELNYELEEKEKTIVILKDKLDEAKKIEELMNHKLKKNIEDYEELEVELDLLRKELTMTIARIKDIVKFEKSTKMLDEILSRQRSPFDKTGLGYDNNLKTSSSVEVNTNLSIKEDEGRSRNYNEELQEHNTSNWNSVEIRA